MAPPSFVRTLTALARRARARAFVFSGELGHHSTRVGRHSRRRRRKRKRKQEQRSLALAHAGGTGSIGVGIQVHRLELAKGYDGLLRGMPEPTLLLGVYRVDGPHVRALGRYLYRFHGPEGFPSKVLPQEASAESLVFLPSTDSRVVLVALAVEEDSGRGIQALYAQLEAGEAMLAWTDDDVAPVPTHLFELSDSAMKPDRGYPVHLLLGDHDPNAHLRGDDWIGANVLWTRISPKRVNHRLHFVSSDGRNDWTAELALTVSSR